MIPVRIWRKLFFVSWAELNENPTSFGKTWYTENILIKIATGKHWNHAWSSLHGSDVFGRKTRQNVSNSHENTDKIFFLNALALLSSVTHTELHLKTIADLPLLTPLRITRRRVYWIYMSWIYQPALQPYIPTIHTTLPIGHDNPMPSDPWIRSTESRKRILNVTLAWIMSFK